MQVKNIDIGLGGGRLIQIANRTLTQMMSYVIDTPDGKTVVIDGGNCCAEDAEALYSYLAERGKKVEAWFFTHAHGDHIGALLYLMDSGRMDIEIGSICLNFPPLEWLDSQGESEEGANQRFFEQIEKYGIPLRILNDTDVIDIGGITVEMISTPRISEKYKFTVNSTSIIFKVKFPKREVLFTGDFDVYAQADFLDRYDPARLRCDILQMPHHGQNGVDRTFYEFVMPKICLYCAPQWLWENNHYRCTDPATAGKGPFTIFETRRWMEELGAEASYTQADGDCIFE